MTGAKIGWKPEESIKCLGKSAACTCQYRDNTTSTMCCLPPKPVHDWPDEESGSSERSTIIDGGRRIVRHERS